MKKYFHNLFCNIFKKAACKAEKKKTSLDNVIQYQTYIGRFSAIVQMKCFNHNTKFFLHPFWILINLKI